MDKNLAPVGMVNIVMLHRILFPHQLAKVGIMSMNLAGKEIAPPRIACKAFNCAIHLAEALEQAWVPWLHLAPGLLEPFETGTKNAENTKHLEKSSGSLC